jgi:dipeptidyl aminopeptidase/acylaminoacyl peptidase
MTSWPSSRFLPGKGAFLLALLLLPLQLPADTPRQALNEGQLILEGAPRIPPTLDDELSRYQSSRSSWFADWTPDGKSIFIKTRFNGINQVHFVDHPGSAREQLTFTSEAVGEISRQPGGQLLAFTMNEGGSGFDQIYLLDPRNGATRLLTDGASLNNRLVWDRSGRRIAWRSTRRDGMHNDIWVMSIDDPHSARPVLLVSDGALWKPVSFSDDGKRLLVQHYAGITESMIYQLDLASGQLVLLVGDPTRPSSNVATGFDAAGKGAHFITNQRDRAAEIGWMPLDHSGAVEFVPENIAWDVTEFELSDDRRRGAFVTNEEGISRLYLFDPAKQRYRRVNRTPIGVISGLKFSPDGRQIGMTISTSRTPSDAFVLSLGRRPLHYRRLVRWTFGEVGGLDTDQFVEPQLIHFRAPFITQERVLMMPAFYYRPRDRKPPYPVVLYIHGGPEGQFRPAFNSTIQMWLDTLGVAVIAPNVRGSLGYGYGYLSMDDGELREHAVHDIGALLDWIELQPELDAGRVAVFGASYGGYMSLATAVHYGERIRAAVDRAGISNFVTYLENTQGYRRDLRRVEYGDERIPETRAFLERISPLNNVDRIDTPLLIVQGRNDPVVPESESAQMVAALRQRGRTVWYMNALNEGHNYARKENRDVFEQVTYLFLRQFLLDTPTPPSR